jgi:hypothetical protein
MLVDPNTSLMTLVTPPKSKAVTSVNPLNVCKLNEPVTPNEPVISALPVYGNGRCP